MTNEVYAVLFIFGSFLLMACVILIRRKLAYKRAVQNGVIGYRKEKVLICGESLVNSYTPAYRDPKSGTIFYGETKQGWIDRF
jgi:hypothetical protein